MRLIARSGRLLRILLHQRLMQQTLDVRLIRKPFRSGKFVCDNQVNGAQPNTDMSRLRSGEQTTDGASPLLIRDFGDIAEVDLFVRHRSEGFELFFLFLTW
jgi:hypothetical protein